MRPRKKIAACALAPLQEYMQCKALGLKTCMLRRHDGPWCGMTLDVMVQTLLHCHAVAIPDVLVWPCL